MNRINSAKASVNGATPADLMPSAEWSTDLATNC
jgi:hypothetical protein